MASLSASPMKPFSAGALEKRLRDLNSTMQSIQSLSTWLLQHRRHAKTIVSVWYRELQKASSSRKLTLVYVANDIIQNGKHKGPEFKNEFSKALPKAFQLVSRDKDDESLQKSVSRVLSVWQERKVFDYEMIRKLKVILTTGSAHSKRSKSESDTKRNPIIQQQVSIDSPLDSPAPPEEPPNTREPPQAEELLQRMTAIDGNNSAAQDMATRAKIANFPPEIFDPQILSKISDEVAARRFVGQLEEAVEVLTDYIARLEKEVEERGELQEMLDVFTWQQQQLLWQAKQRQKEYQTKLERGSAVREELKSHIASLPDLSSFPLTGPSTAGLAPLPSVGDLFS